jgi:hypothetical protein
MFNSRGSRYFHFNYLYLSHYFIMLFMNRRDLQLLFVFIIIDAHALFETAPPFRRSQAVPARRR